MKMREIFFLLIVGMFFFGCDKEDTSHSKLVAIDLITEVESSFFEKTVILFENSNYLIKTNFTIYINSYPFKVIFGAGEEPIPLGGYEEIEAQATQDSKNQEFLLMTDYLYRPSDSTYILAHHLEKGSCLIFDKRENRTLSTIEMEKYMEGGPMTSTGGRRFYLKGVLFLETFDFIS
ncbi:hypothetical protein UMM65_04460 [Aureibaculum sp. 2210JD6-5]|uniref:hypothetical protein n=1 Tax=Aureibaculum sp. 2210JD6-5 TaxID=3103957 RepID=UPI002AAE5122|nr:hypothetical protein [Aureibaculum sp. 2210JD6-5]MDY7394482.1 hypothetical protein [Aureibaculum sp. 2210JD6-5]